MASAVDQVEGEVRLDRQWAFDTALAGLRKQGRKSESEDGGCCYRGPNGTRCGVGFLIPSERYKPSLEGGAADRDDVLNAVLPGLVAQDDASFLERLQGRLHDTLDANLSRLEATAAKFASEFDLTYTAPASQVSS